MRLLSLIFLVTACKPGEKPGGEKPEEGEHTGETGETGETGLPEDTGATADAVSLVLVAEGLGAPTAMTTAPDGTVVALDQGGVAWHITPDGAQPFFDLSSVLVPLDPTYDERGLLGMAFHPDYPTDPRIYTWYSAPLRAGAPEGYDHTNVLSEWTMAGDGTLDMGSQRVLLEIDHPYMNHNGGTLTFGPDRMLYLGIGDGGNKNDVGTGHPAMGNGQDTMALLGKILRIDVDSTDAGEYGIPTDNPFADGVSGRPEIFAYGFRNPYAFSFDRETGEIYAGDLGQDLMEEVDQVKLGGNYGWNIKEGTLCFNPADEHTPLDTCADVGAMGEPLVDPILTYAHSKEGGESRAYEVTGVAIVGGRVYRGTAVPWLAGDYVFGDWTRSETAPEGQLLVGRKDGDAWKLLRLRSVGAEAGHLGRYVRGFGEDMDGELFVVTSDEMGPSGTTGRVWKIAAE